MIARTPARQLPLVVALVLVLALVPAAFAAKGGGGGKPGGGGTTGGSSTVAGPFMINDVNGNGLPNWADTVTFTVSSSATSQPYINLVCSKNGVQVYNSWKGVFAGSMDTNWNFVLGSGSWTGGAASCTAWLGTYTKTGFQRLTSNSFSVGA